MSEIIENMDVEIPEMEVPVEVSVSEPKSSTIFSKDNIMTCVGGTALTVICSAVIQSGVNGLIQGVKKLYKFGEKKFT